MGSLRTPSIIKIHICFSNMKDKSYKEPKRNEIASSFCALLNSHGGKLTITLETGTDDDVQNLKRAIEQRLSDILGFSYMRDHIDLVSSSTDELAYTVEGADCLCTMNYHLYIPTETQVKAVPPKTPIADVKEMLSFQKCIVQMEELVEIGTHCKEFVYKQNIGNPPVESKTVQFKELKAKKSKCVTLGDRMTNKDNKFANYVSAFANHLGGHIYYGVEDDGVVKGEFVEDKEEITKKVSKAINKMVWPTDVEGPKRGQHWEIFFEPVRDANGDIVPATFIIVVYIARCTGGVFTEEPESYRVVRGEVKKMEIKEWRGMIIQTTLPQTVARAGWSSERKEKFFCSSFDKMICLRNNGDLVGFENFIRQLKQNHSSPEVKLFILSQKAAACSWRHEFRKEHKLIVQYDELYLKGNVKQLYMLDSLGLYMKSCLQRSLGKFGESYELAYPGLQSLELTPVGLFPAWFYLHVATLLTTLAYQETCKDRYTKIILAKAFGIKALEHANDVSGFWNCVAEVQQKIYIQLASLCLGWSMYGTMDVKAAVSADDITRAKNCLMMVEKLILEGHPLSSLRQIQYLLSQSGLFFRQSQLSTSTQQPCRSQLASSLRYTKKALKLAIRCHFGEIVRYCRLQIACVTEEIVRDGFRNLKLKKM